MPFLCQPATSSDRDVAMQDSAYSSSVVSVVLAAGKGTRMKSDKPKVLHDVFFVPMIHHVMDVLSTLTLTGNIVVTGHQHTLVETALAGYRPTFVWQQNQNGTGHAVLSCEAQLLRHQGHVLILCGDTPLIRPETLRCFMQVHASSSVTLSVMTTMVDDPTNYGRILNGPDGDLIGIVEERDANPEQKRIREINAGIYCVEAGFLLSALRRVTSENNQGELYLTDIVAIAVQDGKKVEKFICRDSEEVLGVNSRRELAKAHTVLQNRYLDELMDDGVTILQPETVTIDKNVSIDRDTVISPSVFLAGKSRIGKGVTIGPFVYIEESDIGEGASIGAHAHLVGAKVNPGVRIPPHALVNSSED